MSNYIKAFSFTDVGNGGLIIIDNQTRSLGFWRMTGEINYKKRCVGKEQVLTKSVEGANFTLYNIEDIPEYTMGSIS